MISGFSTRNVQWSWRSSIEVTRRRKTSLVYISCLSWKMFALNGRHTSWKVNCHIETDLGRTYSGQTLLCHFTHPLVYWCHGWMWQPFRRRSLDFFFYKFEQPLEVTRSLIFHPHFRVGIQCLFVMLIRLEPQVFKLNHALLCTVHLQDNCM